MKQWSEKGVTKFFEMRMMDTANQLKKDHFDFIYLDMNHDNCAVKKDIP